MESYSVVLFNVYSSRFSVKFCVTVCKLFEALNEFLVETSRDRSHHVYLEHKYFKGEISTPKRNLVTPRGDGFRRYDFCFSNEREVGLCLACKSAERQYSERCGLQSRPFQAV
jgi:hypothetical protein